MNGALNEPNDALRMQTSLYTQGCPGVPVAATDAVSAPLTPPVSLLQQRVEPVSGKLSSDTRALMRPRRGRSPAIDSRPRTRAAGVGERCRVHAQRGIAQCDAVGMLEEPGTRSVTRPRAIGW